MISDDSAKQLHDRATRGETLSAEEQKQLENWYASQDTAESKMLGEHLDTQLSVLMEEQRQLLEEQRELLRLLLSERE
jgi:hypothetical protein